MSNETLSNFILLPELKLWKVDRTPAHSYYWCGKELQTEYCPKCANPSNSFYDKRTIAVKDAPIRGIGITLYITKKRYWCKPCKLPFTEPVAGIKKGKRHTERYRRAVSWACENFSDLTRVRKAMRCSSYFLYHTHYSQIEAKLKEKLNYPWSAEIGIDEHSFKRSPETGRMEFASFVIDYCNKRPREIVHGKRCEDLKEGLKNIPGRENVKHAVIDMCDPFKNFIYEFFPNADITADKFHVLRLLSPALLRKRKEITGTRADAKAKKLMLMSAKNLDYSRRFALFTFLKKYPDMKELYDWKERLHGFYRIKGSDRAAIAFTHMTDAMAYSKLKEIKTLRRTLIKWRKEILNYFKTGLTNGRTEGFNNKAKLVKRRAYGYKSFRNYRLKVLTACF